MKFIVSGKNIEVTEALREKVEKKLGRMERFFNPGTEVHVTMSVENRRQIVEITIPFNGVLLRAEESNGDMYTSIDKSMDILEGQIRKYKSRIEKKLFENAYEPDNFLSTDEVEEETEFNIVRTKRFAIKPMDVEEAILQMNLLGHQFFMFSNADTNEVNVVYKRKAGNYGLIEPEF
jgi:putative sigma-54 modulation protein